MYSFIEFCIRFFQSTRKGNHGQTMTEYALILAAVAIVVYVAYQTMGNDIVALVNEINLKLTAAQNNGP